MNQEQVDVVELQIVERALKGLRHIVRMVLVVPELGRYEELFTGHSALLDG